MRGARDIGGAMPLGQRSGGPGGGGVCRLRERWAGMFASSVGVFSFSMWPVTRVCFAGGLYFGLHLDMTQLVPASWGNLGFGGP